MNYTDTSLFPIDNINIVNWFTVYSAKWGMEYLEDRRDYLRELTLLEVYVPEIF